MATPEHHHAEEDAQRGGEHAANDQRRLVNVLQQVAEFAQLRLDDGAVGTPTAIVRVVRHDVEVGLTVIFLALAHYLDKTKISHRALNRI